MVCSSSLVYSSALFVVVGSHSLWHSALWSRRGVTCASAVRCRLMLAFRFRELRARKASAAAFAPSKSKADRGETRFVVGTAPDSSSSKRSTGRLSTASDPPLSAGGRRRGSQAKKTERLEAVSACRTGAPCTASLTSAAHVLRIPLRQQLRRSARTRGRGPAVTQPQPRQESGRCATRATKR